MSADHSHGHDSHAPAAHSSGSAEGGGGMIKSAINVFVAAALFVTGFTKFRVGAILGGHH